MKKLGNVGEKDGGLDNGEWKDSASSRVYHRMVRLGLPPSFFFHRSMAQECEKCGNDRTDERTSAEASARSARLSAPQADATWARTGCVPFPIFVALFRELIQTAASGWAMRYWSANFAHRSLQTAGCRTYQAITTLFQLFLVTPRILLI